MSIIKKLYFILAILIGSNAQAVDGLKPIQWTVSIQPQKLKIGDVATIIIIGKVPSNQVIYSPEDPIYPAMIDFKDMNGFELVGTLTSIGKPEKHYIKEFESDRFSFSTQCQFTQKIRIKSKILNILGSIDGQTCSDNSCNQTKSKFDLKIDIIENTSNQTIVPDNDKPSDSLVQTNAKDSVLNNSTTTEKNANDTNSTKPSKQVVEESESLTSFILEAMGVGFLAIFTPCVFPMLPMTVSFFIRSAAKDEEEKKRAKRKGIRSAILFGLFVIVIYTIPGALISGTKGPEFNNWLSTHWAPNIFFFLVFLLFGFSFLGWFEIVLPSRFVNKMDSKSGKDSLAGLFFMAFTLVLVSFSCTGPFVGSLLVEASTGHYLKPVIGMFFFSLAIALPFVFFAISPSLLQNLPKSGGWLNAVKVSFGFFELAFAFKFLSIPDQTYHWGILSRDIFFAIWIVVFALWGIYLLGKLKLPHDSPMDHIGVPRLLLAIIVLSFTVYMIPGLWGAPVKLLSGITPPMQYQEFVIGNNNTSVNSGPNTIDMSKVKYSEFHKMPHGLTGFFDLNQAKEYSKKVNKPILIDFTGNACTNCRKMEEYVWVKPEVLNRMKENFVLVSLYVDDRHLLPENEWYISPRDQEQKKTLGEQLSDLQISKYNNSSQPQYIITDSEGNNLLGNEFTTYNSDESIFISFLDRGLKAFQDKK